jgi:outer membrane protein assembly factor BamB
MTYSGTILTKRRRWGILLASVSASMLALSGCGGGSGDSAASDGEDSKKSSAQAASDRTEVGALTPRIVLAHDGGVTTLDSSSGEVIDETDVEGYSRLNPAGDGRTVMISAGSSITPYDTGLIAQAHGDHFHYYTQDPALLSDAAIEAEEPGHVVPHGERTATFADGTGEITVFDSAALADGQLKTVAETQTDAPHHGVAVPLSDGSLLHTVGTEDERHTVVVENADGEVTAKTEDCPGVHGEATAKPTDGGDVVTLGCENGPVMFKDGKFQKIDVKEDFQRSGNQAGDEDSPIVLTDYKVEEDPEGGIERPTKVGLLDTRDGSFDTVDLGSEYWFRSLDRGPDGEALVLTADGKLNIIDPESGKVEHSTKVAEEWSEPEQWQEAGPMLSVADGTAFVADSQNKKLTMVDIETGEAYQEIDLPEVPHEIQVTTGTASGEYEVSPGSDSEGEDSHEGHDHEGHDHEGHDHEGHDHEHDEEGDEA